MTKKSCLHMIEMPIQTMPKTVDIATRKQCLYAHKCDFLQNVHIAPFAKMLAGDKSPNPKIVNFGDGCAFIER